ncbi:MBOAT family protein [Marivirga sp. S37H4]|uniref:MBOAT family protein n=1 Tax=Marivirga aurantiaca TaxID=2802615 RepID=A0A934WX42_9BACT|nr:MBOAT family protein [Marivirga aurantiaca]MBK6264531.1 MBOAT family protein [Marivirga aurantiaca]
MLFNSFTFWIFFTLFFMVYWLIHQKKDLRNIWILLASYVFYSWWDWRFLSLIIISTLIDYFVAQQIDKSTDRRRKKWLLSLSVIANLGFLAYFKYANFFIDNFVEVLQTIGFQANMSTLNIILPVGISFYTFQTMSYTIDVYRQKMPATSRIIDFAAYVSFFPQLVAGPIERAQRLLPQFLQKTKFSFRNAQIGTSQIVWGLFKKIVIADNCAIYVDQIFSNYAQQDSLSLILGAVLFAFQIYCDFSGYSDIAIGLSRLLGFELMTNFRYPYFSRDIAEFWRRWHISLSTWFRDYLYIPLGGSKNGKYLALRNIFIIFIVSGFWHGANWTFIIWGALHALYYVPLFIFGTNRNNLDVIASETILPSFKSIFGLAVTFILTTFAWVFFRSASASDAFDYISLMFQFQNVGTDLLIPIFLWVEIIVLLLIDYLSRKKDFVFFENQFIQILFLIATIIQLILFGYYESDQSFIYFQF